MPQLLSAPAAPRLLHSRAGANVILFPRLPCFPEAPPTVMTQAPAGPEEESLAQPPDAQSRPPLLTSVASRKAWVGLGSSTARLGASQPATQDVVTMWQQQGNGAYALPDEHTPDCGAELKHKYRPPATDLGGVLVACTVISCWALLYWHALFQVKLPSLGADGYLQPHSSWIHIAAVFFSLEFLYTGLFITCHDAMHGTIAMRNRPLNDFLGKLAISLYAWFDYDMLHKKHWEHHNHTGKVGQDPDFHRGNPAMIPWFFRFMLEYMSLWQFVKIAWWANAMQWLGCPQENLLLFMTAAPVLSAFRLFYYGTYVPHHPEPGAGASQVEMSWPKSRTSHAPALISLLTCYHFDLHWEHHRWPYAPWWQLPLCRELSGRRASAPTPGASRGTRTGLVGLRTG